MDATLLLYSVLAFAAGTMLNGMPCVLPVLPFKVQAILRTIDDRLPSRLRAAGALLAGSVSFFLVLGSLSAVFGFMWGQLFQYAGLRIVLSIFFVASAVATFTGWSIGLPRSIQRLPMTGDLSAFLSGALAGILSTPCSGPFLGAVLAYSATRPTAVTLVIFTAIGCGLAAPLMILTVWPGLIQRVKVSGRLGAALKTVLGIVLLAAGLFYAQDILPPVYRRIAWLLMAAGSGMALLLKSTTGSAARWRPVGVMALAMVMITGFQHTDWQNGAGGLAWDAYAGTALPPADRPVMIYFGADWCVNCRTLERTTFRDEDLRNLVSTRNVRLLKVDLTRPDETRRAVLEQYGGYGIPFIVLLDGRGTAVRRFTGIIGSRTLMAELGAIPPG
jgi:thiol:disulfide interchange protein DsbD